MTEEELSRIEIMIEEYKFVEGQPPDHIVVQYDLWRELLNIGRISRRNRSPNVRICDIPVFYSSDISSRSAFLLKAHQNAEGVQ